MPSGQDTPLALSLVLLLLAVVDQFEIGIAAP
jgi:hypothetical protein